MRLYKFVLPGLLMASAFASGHTPPLRFSQSEWENPGRPGSSLWLRNLGNRGVTVKSMYLKTDGIRGIDRITVRFGTQTFRFHAAKVRRSAWTRLQCLTPGRIRVRARDSLLVSGFDCGKAKAELPPPRDYYLELKLKDARGRVSVLTVSQRETLYVIGETRD